MKTIEALEEEVARWPQVAVHDHRFGGREFRLGDAEVGHVHPGGVVDIPFPRAIRDALLARGLAREHRWVPNSGWITFQVRGEEDLPHALRLMRLSYVRYTLRHTSESQSLLAQEEELHLTPEFRALLVPLVASPGHHLGESRQG